MLDCYNFIALTVVPTTFSRDVIDRVCAKNICKNATGKKFVFAERKFYCLFLKASSSSLKRLWKPEPK